MTRYFTALRPREVDAAESAGWPLSRVSEWGAFAEIPREEYERRRGQVCQGCMHLRASDDVSARLENAGTDGDAAEVLPERA